MVGGTCSWRALPGQRPPPRPRTGSSTRRAFPKAGCHSAGVQRQYCGALGKTANCQMAVSLHRADEAAGTSQPLGWQLFLPESWTDDPARCQRAGIPPGAVHQSKLDLALGLIDQALWLEVTGGRRARRRGLRRQLRVARGPACARPLLLRTRAVDDHRLAASTLLRTTQTGASGLSRPARAAAQPRAQAPAGHRAGPARLGVEKGDLAGRGPRGRNARALRACPCGRHTAGNKARNPSGSRKRSSSSGQKVKPRLHATGWRAYPRRKSPWPSSRPRPRHAGRVEQDYRELKDELGLDHFEGRSWQGFHHHVALVTAAFVFLRQEQARLRRHAQKKPAAAHAAAGAS